MQKRYRFITVLEEPIKREKSHVIESANDFVPAMMKQRSCATRSIYCHDHGFSPLVARLNDLESAFQGH